MDEGLIGHRRSNPSWIFEEGDIYLKCIFFWSCSWNIIIRVVSWSSWGKIDYTFVRETQFCTGEKSFPLDFEYCNESARRSLWGFCWNFKRLNRLNELGPQVSKVSNMSADFTNLEGSSLNYLYPKASIIKYSRCIYR